MDANRRLGVLFGRKGLREPKTETPETPETQDVRHKSRRGGAGSGSNRERQAGQACSFGVFSRSSLTFSSFCLFWAEPVDSVRSPIFFTSIRQEPRPEWAFAISAH